MAMFRQGDVLLVRDAAPSAAEVIERSARVVLVLGEATGHAHVACGQDLELSRGAAGDFLAVPRGAELRHDEHETIDLPPGTYRIVRQREYVPRAPPREIGERPGWDYVAD
jgi:hypothetical protein